MPRELFCGLDHANRSWRITARPYYQDAQLVTFARYSRRGYKTLNQTAAWHPDTGWDMTRWFPTSPMPVPLAVMLQVMDRLANLQELTR